MFKTILSVLLLAVYVQAFVTVNMQQLPNETIRIIVTNPSEKDVKLLKHPHSVLETELATAKFTFTSVDNSDLPSSKDAMILWGPKYTAKIDGTYVTIPAGGSIHFDHDLLKSYTFPKFDKTQRFTISLAQSSFVTPDHDIAFATPSLTITISGRHSNPFPSLLRPFLTTGAFDCTDDQRRALEDWAAWVKKWSSENSDYLNDKDEVYAKPTIYTYWFGDIDAGGGLYYLQTTFNRLKAVSLNTFACGECTGNGGLDDPYDVGIIDLGPTDTGDVSLFVCSTFWDLIRNENDAEPIRRMAHAAVTSRRIAQAQEYAQGATDCHQLALDHPEKAIKNADSMARFILWKPV